MKRKHDPQAAAARRSDLVVAGLALLVLVAAVALGAAIAPTGTPAPASLPQDVRPWSDLRPSAAGHAQSLATADLSAMQDADPRAVQLLRRMRVESSKAPAVATLHGTRLALAGYVVPLDGSRARTGEFLLVPYFGACIHTPPPPANQVVHVTLADELPLRTMDHVVVRGTLEVVRAEFGPASSGYRIAGAEIETR